MLLYHSPEIKREVLYSHLKYGEEKQGLAYVCSEDTPNMVREEMKKFGLNADRLRTSGKLAISNYDEMYIVDGKVNTAKIMTAFSELTQRYTMMGLDGLRASAEMSCFFKENKISELLNYEYVLHRKFKFPAEGICAYNINEMQSLGQLALIMPILRAHSTVIMAGSDETLILDPIKVEDEDVEHAMKVELKASA